MKVFLKAYINQNLGDDLFIDIISSRYKNTLFYICDNAKYLKKGNLLFYKKNILQKILGKLLYIISFKMISYDYIISRKCECSVILGGSMFIEKNNNFFSKLKKPLMIIGSNFGPYKSKKFKDRYYNYFKKSNDVCFREEKSYKLFNELSNVRYATDRVFSYNNNRIKVYDNNSVVISVIDCKFKEEELGIHCSEEYEKKIVELINYFDEKEYKIVLMSFCQKQGDEKSIEKIMKMTNVNVSKYYYRGNIEEAMSIIASSTIVVGSRFHANIIGLLYNKVVLPIAYSDKTINVLRDMEFKGKIFDIRKMNDFNIEKITTNDLKYKFNNTNLKKDAEKHFKYLDSILKNKE